MRKAGSQVAAIPYTDSKCALGKTPKDLGREIITAAVVKWFELGRILQGKAAEILRISRSEFLDILSDYRISAWQYTREELDEELAIK